MDRVASEDLLTIPEVVNRARRNVTRDVWDYSCGGAESETTLRRNRAAFATATFRPRVLRGHSGVSISTTFLGHPLAVPILLAPVGSITTFHPDGALACARVAQAKGTAAFVGTLSAPALEVVRHGSASPLFFQVYVYGGRSWLKDLVERVEHAGYQALCVTVDVAAYGRRERDLSNRYFPRQSVERPNLAGGATSVPDIVNRDHYNAVFTWEDVAWLRTTTKLPIMIKGVLDREDALLAVQHGVDAVYVSNHGGRQLDHGPSSFEVLPEIVEAVDGRAQVVLDGGIMRGTDVVKCLASGATAVSIGKLMCWGLAADGEAGLGRVLDLLAEEMQVTMSNLGAGSTAELGPQHLRPTTVFAGEHVWPA